MSAVVFDCDGVIVDSEPLSDEAWRIVLRRHGHDPTDADLMATTGLSEQATYELFAAAASLPAPDVVIEEAMAECRRLLSTELEAYPDAVEAIKGLAMRGVPLAVASSSPRRNLDIKLDRFDLARYFDVTVAGDEVAAAKPAPDIYAAAARGLGMPPEECLAVEDTATGAASAASARMRVVTVDRGRNGAVPGYSAMSDVDASMLLLFLAGC
jgi:HAD superfamily hydrolase (TIGR01509 family)